MLIEKVIEKTGMEKGVVRNIIQLLDEWNTVPFIARYRKELTKGATDEQLRDFHDVYTYTKNLEARKEDVIRLIDEKWMLTPELKKQIMDAKTLARVEDLYRPFKEKKNTRATIAKAKWLEPLAAVLKDAILSMEGFRKKAEEFIKDTGDKKTSVVTIEEAIWGAQDIIAEEVGDHANLRETIKIHEQNHWLLQTKATKKFEDNGVYKIYKSYSKKISQMPSYAYLAVCRAEKDKQISLKFQVDEERTIDRAFRIFVAEEGGTSIELLEDAVIDGLKRLLVPSIEREIRKGKKEWSDEAAIKVFGENMKNLLLTPPIKGINVLGFDPAYRTGCKLAVLDYTGKFLYDTVIYPTPPRNDLVVAEKVLLKLIKDYKIELIIIGNGTGSRESEKFVANVIKNNKLKTQYMVTSEAGASVYSASKLAQEEYPKLDVTVRGAISIAHRVQDALSEFTKIDPKAIWVGQYQHDVDQKLLKHKLDEKVEDTVNSVWVDVNTASYPLLQHIAGLSETIAKNIVDYRDTNGVYTKKAQLKKVKWLWPKAYEQAIWFLRIKEWKEALDATGIHPETHKATYSILENEFDIKKKEIELPLEVSVSTAKIQEISDKYEIGYETLEDIFKELASPGLDPREEIDTPQFKSDVLEVEDLKEDMILDGVIRNVTDFGAFVDIGLHNDGLVHISQLSDTFVSNPSDIVSVWQNVKVKVLTIDVEREKVSLSMKLS